MTIYYRNKEVLKLVKANFICYLFIVANFNPPAIWEIWILIPALYIGLALEDNAWQ
jgi:hypothetical protein